MDSCRYPFPWLSDGRLGTCPPSPHELPFFRKPLFEILVSFNPLSVIQSGRLQHIDEHFSRRAAVIASQDIRKRIENGLPFKNYCKFIREHSIAEAGYGPKSNKHAGVSTSLHKSYFWKPRIIAIGYPLDEKLQGRAIVVRTERAGVDITYMSEYPHLPILMVNFCCVQFALGLIF